MFDRMTIQNTSGRPKFLAVPSMTSQIQRRRVFVSPERTRLTQAEKKFAVAIQKHVRSTRNYEQALQVYRNTANAIYRQADPNNLNLSNAPLVPTSARNNAGPLGHRRPALERNMATRYKLYGRKLNQIPNTEFNQMPPTHKAFIKSLIPFLTSEKKLFNAYAEYRDTATAVRQQYRTLFTNLRMASGMMRDELLENLLKEKTVRKLQYRVRQKQTAKRMEATAAFIRSMSKRSFPQTLTHQILSSLNRRR